MSVELMPCGRGPQSHACSGCNCGLETSELSLARTEINLLRVSVQTAIVELKRSEHSAGMVARDLQSILDSTKTI